MGTPSYTVKVNGTSISNVQEFTFTQGKQSLSEPLRPGTGTIRGRRPDLLPTIQIGQSVQISVPPGAARTFWFRVADFTIEYGTVAAMDTWQLVIEDVLATFGRCTTSVLWAAGASVSSAVSSLAAAAGVTIDTLSPTASTLSAQTLTNVSALETLGKLDTQEQGYFAPYGGFNTLSVAGRTTSGDLTVYDASDDGTGTDPVKYAQLQFLGLADNYASKVIVNADGLAQQVAGTGTFAATFDTYNETNGAALDLANYLLGAYSDQTQSPFRMTARWSANTVSAQGYLAAGCNLIEFAWNIKFRSATYPAQVIGYTVTGMVDDIIYTYYLANVAYYGSLTLNSPYQGLLDTNRLGF